MFMEHHEPITIGAHAWTCAGAIIVPGVIIGDRTLVAAGAAVTRDVPPGTRVGGVPAKPIDGVPADKNPFRVAAPSYPQ